MFLILGLIRAGSLSDCSWRMWVPTILYLLHKADEFRNLFLLLIEPVTYQPDVNDPALLGILPTSAPEFACEHQLRLDQAGHYHGGNRQASDYGSAGTLAIQGLVRIVFLTSDTIDRILHDDGVSVVTRLEDYLQGHHAMLKLVLLAATNDQDSYPPDPFIAEKHSTTAKSRLLGIGCLFMMTIGIKSPRRVDR